MRIAAAHWGPLILIIYCEKDGAVPVPEADLPVILPRVEDFKPTIQASVRLRACANGTRRLPGMRGSGAARNGRIDTFLDSAWYFLRYPSTDRDDVSFDAELTRRWLPVHSYIGGNEHAVLHLMYARFVTMALRDLGLIDFEEPFRKFRAHGLIINEGAKMSKSRGNVIVPDTLLEKYGADTVRLYLMFLGPFEHGGDYRNAGIEGPQGFLSRLWQSVLNAENGPPQPNVERKLHQTIRQVTEQLPLLQYNTAIAAMMEYLNVVRAGGRTARRAEVEPLVVLVAPFAPHIAEELYQRLGHNDGLFASARWPAFDPAKIVEDSIEVAVQVNGKLRGRVIVSVGASEADVKRVALADDSIARHVAGGTVKKAIYVRGKLLNLVLSA